MIMSNIVERNIKIFVNYVIFQLIEDATERRLKTKRIKGQSSKVAERLLAIIQTGIQVIHQLDSQRLFAYLFQSVVLQNSPHIFEYFVAIISQFIRFPVAAEHDVCGPKQAPNEYEIDWDSFEFNQLLEHSDVMKVDVGHDELWLGHKLFQFLVVAIDQHFGQFPLTVEEFQQFAVAPIRRSDLVEPLLEIAESVSHLLAVEDLLLGDVSD